MIQTRQEVVQEILMDLYGGMIPNDNAVSERLVLRKVNNWIAEQALKSAYGYNNLESLLYADDIFNITFKNLNLTVDTDYKLKYTPLPALPVGLPRQRSFNVFATDVKASMFKPMSRFEYQRISELPSLPKVFYFIENDNAYFDFSFVNKLTDINQVHMVITTSGALDLSAKLNLPDDMIAAMKISVLMELRVMTGLGIPATK